MTDQPPARGDIWFHAGFEEGDALRGWSGQAALETGFESAHAVCVRRRGNDGGAATISRRVPVARLRGVTIRATARIKAQDVSAKPNPWNGVKFMLKIDTPQETTWPQAPIGTGTFDWTCAAFTARIPAGATSATLILGLEHVTGTAWFDQVSLSVAKVPHPRPAPVVGPMFKGHDLPRLRGAMVGPHIDAEGLRTLGRDWNANLIRWQLIRHGPPGRPSSLPDYDAWLETALNRLDAALPHCRACGLLVVVDLHSPPGGKATVSGYIGSDDRLFTDRGVQEKFVVVWERIARRYKDEPMIWGFDLANEPVEEFVGEGCDDWHALAERAARAIREVDADRTIIVEAPPWGSPASLADFTPIAVPHVVYSAHMYIPGAFTHQQVFGGTQRAVIYPGEIDGTMWDKAALERALAPVVAFQRAYNVHIYIGEFSAIRWAPEGSAARYLRDVIDIFETHGWDWSYHAFREWQGWSVEHGEDRADPHPAKESTERQKLLQSWFARNAKPRVARSGG